MTELGIQLERLGLEQYLDAFVGEGFDTWETLLDIQESDFDALNVRLGHRRKLQRAIADHRGIPLERLVAASSYDGSTDTGKGFDATQAASAGIVAGAGGGGEAKRKYRRHPKPDENAPERPPSAYVIFSNKIREEVKDQNLSFTRIAKLVGERWQKLDPKGKEPFEDQANAAKERYNIQLSTYKKTDAYKEYTQYLAEFKAKHGGASEGKRPRLEQESSGGSISAKSLDLPAELLVPGAGGHARGGSTGSMGSAAHGLHMHSPATFSAPPLPSQALQSGSVYSQRGAVTTSRGGSPSGLQSGREMRRRGQVSNQSSLSDDSPPIRSDSDPLARTASLSLSTAHSATPPLPPLPVAEYFDQGMAYDNSRRFPNMPMQMATMNFGQQSGGAIGPGGSFGQTLPSPATSDGSFHGRSVDIRGYGEPARGMQPPSLTPGSSAGTIPLPPLMAADRYSNPQRTLPLPRTSPTLQQQPSLPPVSHLGDSPTPFQFNTIRRPQHSQTGSPFPLERSESEAADALAGLAAGEPRPDTAKPPDPNRQRQ